MPLYEFECKQCDQQFEFLQRAEQTPICPKCESPKVEKLLSMTASPKTSGESAARELPMMNCGTPRCCGGGCQLPE